MAVPGNPAADTQAAVGYDDPPEEEIIDVTSTNTTKPAGTADSNQPQPGEPRIRSHFHERGDAPAHVPPIEKIGRIPSLGRPVIAEDLLKDLTGKLINEFGDVIDSQGNDDVLGQVAGDLPDMVGRKVANNLGDVLDDDGNLIGYVRHVGTESDDEDGKDDQHGNRKETQTLDNFTQGASKSFQVDGSGNILDHEGNIVGKMHDIKKGGRREDGAAGGGGNVDGASHGSTQDSGSPPKQNAETFRKQDDSPSDIFLDVKSTTEGIQLVIRIPTVFPGRPGPSVHIS